MSWTRKMLVSLLLTICGLAAFSSGAMAQEPSATELMAEANERYELGEFAEAAQQYEALVGAGYRDAAVYYNLGNAYLEDGDLGRAILNYLRAEELSPRDPDVIANLDLARSLTVDQLQAEGDSLVASVADFGRQWATTTEYGLAALLLWAIVGLSVAPLIVRPAMRRRALLRGGAVISFVSMLIPLALLVSMLQSNPYTNTGVVTAGRVEVLYGPGPQYDENFALHSGAQVRLVDSRPGWLQVSLPGGELQGWLLAHTIGAVADANRNQPVLPAE